MKGKILNNRYLIKNIIGIGGMAYVYDAYDKILEREVAIKVLKDDYLEKEDFISKFKLEATSSASIIEDNIVAIYDVGSETIEDRTVEYIVMEKVIGKTLKDIIEERAPLDNDEIVYYAIEIAKALQAAHRKGVVHRDIKPANILVGEDNKVKVTDFGIARVATSATITYTSSILGTVHYISPEQAKAQPTDSRSDLYSLGIVLYEMATGEVPFDAETPVSIAIKHLEDTPESVRTKNPKINENLSKIIDKLLIKEVSGRYQTASELISDLQNYKTVSIAAPIKNTQKIDKEDLNGATNEVTYKSSKIKNTPISNRNKKKSKKRFLWIPIILIAIVLASLLLNSALAEFARNRELEDRVEVPNLVDYSEENALNKLDSLGLVPSIENREYSENIQRGFVISQSVEANSYVDKGSQVNLIISLGQELVTVPRVINFTIDDAKIMIEQAGFEIGGVTYENNEKAKDRVISQFPDAGDEKPLSSKINLTVSLGPLVEQVRVPNLRGQNQETALETLRSLNLIPGQISQEYSDSPEGNVIRQSVEQGSEVDAMTAIDLTISRGPEPQDNNEPTQDPQPETPQVPDNNDQGQDNQETPVNPVQNKLYRFNINPPSNSETFNVKVFNLKDGRSLLFERDYNTSDLTDGKALIELEAPEDADIEILLNDEVAQINYDN